MNKMKYVVVKAESGIETLVIFPEYFSHDRFAEVLSHIRTGNGRNWKREYREPISAGFTDGETCFGRSESLNLDSRLTDTILLNKGGFSQAKSQ